MQFFCWVYMKRWCIFEVMRVHIHNLCFFFTHLRENMYFHISAIEVVYNEVNWCFWERTMWTSNNTCLFFFSRIWKKSLYQKGEEDSLFNIVWREERAEREGMMMFFFHVFEGECDDDDDVRKRQTWIVFHITRWDVNLIKVMNSFISIYWTL